MMPCAFILEAIGGFFTALFGAGFGAYAAYFLAKRQEEDKRSSECHGHLVEAFYILAARLSAVENFSRKYLSEDREAMGDSMHLSLAYQYCPRESISIQSLAFMADANDCDLVHELSVSEAKYFNFVDALEERNRDVRVVIAAAHKQGLRMDEPIGPTFANYPEVDLAIRQNGNLVGAARSALRSASEEVAQLAAVINRRFPDAPRLRAAIPKIEEANKTSHSNRH